MFSFICKYCSRIILFLFLFRSISSNAQTFYSTDPSYVLSKQAGNNILHAFQPNYPDTSLSGFHEFFPRNFLGNTGLPSPEYILRYGADEPGFRFYQLPYRNDRFIPADVNFYRSKGPYAQLTGIAGSKQLQIFKLFFTHTYRGVNVSLRFNRYTSQGFYLRQQSFTNNFYLSSNFTSKKKRYGYYFYFLNNGNRHNENGGIKGDTLSLKALTEGKDILGVKISNASRDNKQYNAMLNPWIKLNKSLDTLNSTAHFLQLNSGFNTELIQYKDQGIYTDKYYLLMYHDTARTFDSAHVFKLFNSVSYVLKVKGDFSFSAGYKHELNKVWQKTDSLFSNHSVQAEAIYKKSLKNDSLLQNGFHANVKSEYVISGVNAGNYLAEAKSRFFSGDHQLQLSANYERRNADYIYNYWVSNHFVWFNNGFVPQEKMQVRGAYSYLRYIGTSVLLNTYRNYLYFDEVAQPRQYSGGLQALSINVHASKIIFRRIGMFADYNWQTVSNSAILRVPGHSVTARLFYTGSHFKNNLVLNTGLQLNYFSGFYGYAYMPATNIFYLQEKFQTTPYPFLDIFINARIRPVNFFLKIENILQGFAGTGYSFVPGYYQPDRAFRFGLNWMFFD